MRTLLIHSFTRSAVLAARQLIFICSEAPCVVNDQRYQGGGKESKKTRNEDVSIVVCGMVNNCDIFSPDKRTQCLTTVYVISALTFSTSHKVRSTSQVGASRPCRFQRLPRSFSLISPNSRFSTPLCVFVLEQEFAQ